MADNDASNAGMEVIQGHINMRIAKLKNMCSSGDAASERTSSLFEDMQDYYERAFQLRRYRIESLEEELKEKNNTIVKATNKATRSVRFVYAMGFVMLLCGVEFFSPGVVEEYASTPLFLVTSPSDWEQYFLANYYLNKNFPLQNEIPARSFRTAPSRSALRRTLCGGANWKDMVARKSRQRSQAKSRPTRICCPPGQNTCPPPRVR